MPKFRDWVAGRTAVTIADDDELYVRDDDADESKRITWGNVKTALGSTFAPLASPTFTGTVTVPAATAANHAAVVTAIDATTGRLAIGGREVGDTGWRDISSLLSTGWTLGTNGVFRIRRVGNVVSIHFRNLAYSSGGTTAIINATNGPQIAGFAPSATNQFLYTLQPLANGTLNLRQGHVTTFPEIVVAVTESGPTGQFTFTTTASWPSALPGTAA